jgi:EXPERA (EXPanded EBP superfamily)
MSSAPSSSTAPLPTKDRVIIAGLVFFSVFNVTVDLYLVLNSKVLVERATTNWFAYLWAIYAEADRGWVVNPWSLAQETLNVAVATPVNLWLIRAIAIDAPRRHPLQLALGACMVYSIVLYHAAGHLSGYAGMRERSVSSFAMYYGSTVPWLFFHAYLAYDSASAIHRRFRVSR